MLLIRNAYVLTMEARDYPQGDVLVDDGRIVAVGENLAAPAGAKVLDAKGLYCMPGIIDAHCHIGMDEEVVGWAGEDTNEGTDPVTPQLRAIDAVNPRDPAFPSALEAGVTTVATGPGSANVIGGQFVLMHTNTAGRVDESVLRFPLALKTAYGENPKRFYGVSQRKTPQTRMATASIMRQAFAEAREYLQKRENPDEGKRPAIDLGKETLAAALRGELPVKIHCHRADDIFTAIRVADEFGLRFSLEHCTEGWMIADALAAEQKKRRMPVIVGPLMHTRSKIECANLSMKAPGILHAHGVRFAMMTDHPVIPAYYLPVQLACAVREGLPERDALRAITLDAAWAVGAEDELGSLSAGKRADLVLSSHYPLDSRNRVKTVLVDGEVAFEA